MKRWRAFLIVAGVHLFTTVIITVAEYDLGLVRFGTREPAGMAEALVVASARMLRFPLVEGALTSGVRFLGPSGYTPFPPGRAAWVLGTLGLLLLLNSLFWASVVEGSVRVYRRGTRAGR